MVNGPDRVYVERGGRIEPHRGRLRRRGGAAQRDRADPRAARTADRRAEPDGRRPARRRLAGQRRDPAAGDRRPPGLDPPFRRPAARPRASWSRSGTLTAAQRELLRGGGRRAAQRPGQRRHRLRQDDAAQRPLRASSTPAERVVTIEDAAELRLQQPHVVRLESRPAGIEGRGEVTIRDLLRNALRMRPDRIVIGEVRGAEALDLLTALNTGHDGALSTVHANSPADALEPAGDAGADGGGRAAARGDRRAGAAGDRPGRPPASAAPTAPGVAEIAEWCGRRRGRAHRRSGGRLTVPLRLAGLRRRRWLRAGGAGGAAGQPGRGALAAAGAGAAAPGRSRGLRALERGAPPPRRARGRAPRCSAAGSWPGRRWRCRSAVAGPALAGWAISSRRRRYRARGRALAAGRRDRDRRLADAPAARCGPRCRPRRASLDGPPRSELARLGAELDLGAADGGGGRRPGGGGCARRGSTPSPRRCSASAWPAATWPASCAASPPAPRSATGSPRTPASATAQARFTGLLVVAMPSGGALFAELIQPGFLAKLLGSPPAAAVLLALAAVLQLVGFVAIRRFSRVVE